MKEALAGGSRWEDSVCAFEMSEKEKRMACCVDWLASRLRLIILI